MPAVQPSNKALLIVLACCLAACMILSVAVALIIRIPPADRPSKRTARPEATEDPNERLRQIYASSLQARLRASGCASCAVATIAGILSITHLQAPADVAGQLLGERKTVKALKDLEFTTIRVRQGSGPPFDFKIK